MKLLLAGYIGNTKVDLYLIDIDNDNQQFLPPLFKKLDLIQKQPNFVAMVKKFLQQAEQKLQLDHPLVLKKAYFAISDSVENNTCNMTNLEWVLDGRSLQDSLNISKVKLINDFAAIGYGISVLKKDSDLVTLRKGKPQDGSPIAIIGAGAGTGLKETFLLPKSDGSYQPHSTEGSHADFAPVVTNELNNFEFNGRKLNEYDLLEFIRSKKANLHHVSVERVVSGSGIISIYQFLRDKTNWRESDNIKQIVNRWEESNNETNRQIEDPVPVIINAALDQRNPDPLCEKTMKIFIKFYGGEAGNLAVKVLPYTGLYVAGGLTTHLIDLMKEEKFLNAFLNAFLNKGRMKSLLEKIPVFLVKNSEEVGVIGAATFVSQD